MTTLRPNCPTFKRAAPDGNLRWTAFGPTNAKLHRINTAVTLGDAGTAVDVARGIDLSTITVTERKATLLIDTARVFLQWGRHERHTSPFALRRKSHTRKLPGGLRSTGSSANLLPQPPLSGVTPRTSPLGSECPVTEERGGRGPPWKIWRPLLAEYGYHAASSATPASC
jgi:hypothetical protein